MFSKRPLAFRIAELRFFKTLSYSFERCVSEHQPPKFIDIADVSDVARFYVRVSPKFRARLVTWEDGQFEKPD